MVEFIQRMNSREKEFGGEGTRSFIKYALVGSLIKKLNGILYRKYKKGKTEEEKTSFPVFGEIGHPDRLIVDLHGVSHYTENFKIKRDWLVGDVIIPGDTIASKELEALLDAKLEFVFRPRGVGIINENNEVTNYEVYAFDAINKRDDAFL